MSYDVDIGGEDFNHTSNTYQLLCDLMPGHDPKAQGIKSLDGITGAEAAEIIEAGIERLHDMYADNTEESLRKKYDAPNGWGTITSSILFLSRLMAACHRHPLERISVCC